MSEQPAAGESWIDLNRPSKTVTLSSAIRDGEKTLTSLRLRQPCVLDIEQIPAEAMQRPLEFLRCVVARAAGVSDTAIRLLTIPDMAACTKALLDMGFTVADAYILLEPQSLSLPRTGPTGSA